MLALFSLAITTSRAQAQNYTLVDLGILDGATSQAYAINTDGRSVGVATKADSSFRAFVWGGSLSPIEPLLGEAQSHAMDINDNGDVVALSYNLGAIVSHGLLFSSGTTTNLGSIAPRGLNNSGTVVGSRIATTPTLLVEEHAARWQTGSITDLGTLGGRFSQAMAVNDGNQIVGWSTLAGDVITRPMLWHNGSIHDLGTLGGAAGQANAISNSGYVVGYAKTSDDKMRAFRYQVSAGDGVQERLNLGVLGGDASMAYGVNEAGDVVGTSNHDAFLWRQGTLMNLNDTLPSASPWHLQRALGINDHGMIVGTGTLLGFPHAFMLVPPPEVTGDFSGDGTVEASDYALFAACMNGPQQSTPPSGCTVAQFFLCDMQQDQDVDLADFTAWQNLVAAP